MENFTFQNATKIIFGKGTEEQVGIETKRFSDKVLLHYGGGSIKKSGLYDSVIKSLKDSGIQYIELAGVKPNPRLDLVKQGIDICRKNSIKFILTVGGGSVIDSAKAIAMGVPYEGDVWDFYSGKAVAQTALPIGVVLTIPAAGSETSPSTVITNEDGQFKRGCTNLILRPQFCILNPELTYTLPDYQTACGASDIMAHVMERYFSNTKNVELSDRYCEATLKTMIHNVPLALKNNKDYAARAEIMWAGTNAHSDLIGMGRVEDWASHMIEHEISGIYDIAHGAGLSIVFPAWMKYVYKKNVDKFVQFAVRVWNVDMDYENPERTALEGIKRITDFFREVGLPVTLSDANIPNDMLEEMAQKATAGGEIGGFMKLGKEDVLNILKLAI